MLDCFSRHVWARLYVVELPTNLSVFQIGADFVLATASDDFGVEYVHLYRIEK